MKPISLGQLIQSYFLDHLRVHRGLLPASIRTYRDVLRGFLLFLAAVARRKITRLSVEDLTFDHVQGYLRHLEEKRHNHIRTRNHRLAILHSFFDYLAKRMPEMLTVCEQIAAIPMKRVAPPQTCYLERDQVARLFKNLPTRGRHAARDRALLIFLYNTGARAQEVADLQVGNLELRDQARVHLRGKGDKWRTCPLWGQTVEQLQCLLGPERLSQPDSPIFTSQSGRALTRFGIYKIVRRLTDELQLAPRGHRNLSPHVFRHTAAVHLLEAGVEVNVIRGWLGHASLQTTNRYAEISTRTKEAALSACEPSLSGALPGKPVWQDDKDLLAWLASL